MTITTSKNCAFAASPTGRKLLLFFLLILLASPVLAGERPSLPPSTEADAPWRDEGFTAAAAGEWRYYGFKPAEARDWQAAGIEFPGWANQWKSEGFRAAEAGRWKDLANVYTAAGFVKAGFGFAEARVWLDLGVKSSLRAREYRDSGIDAETGARYWRLGIYPEEAGPWFKAGFSPEETLAWRWGPKDIAFYHTAESPYSRTVYRLEEMTAWRDAGFSPEQAQRLSDFQVGVAEAGAWLAEGIAAYAIMAWRDSGFSPTEAGQLRAAGFSPAQAEAARFEEEWAAADEISELAYALELLADGRLKILLRLKLINRPGGAYHGEEFSLPLPAETRLWYGLGHYRRAAPAYAIGAVMVDGVPTAYRHARERLAIPLPADGKAREILISYTTNDHVLYFPRHDELSFTALSDNPGAAIRRASVSLVLPPGAEVVFTEGMAGLPGRRDLTARVTENPPGKQVVFETTRVLRQRMALRVNVAFTKGHVDPGLPGKFKALDLRWHRALTGLLLFLAGLVLSSAYLLWVWHKHGRDPRGGPLLNRSAPPESLSPAAARQILGRGRVDGVSLLAALMYLAQQGSLRIAENGGTYTLRADQPGAAKLHPAEAALLATLFAEGPELVLRGRAARHRLNKGLRAMREVLEESFGNYYRSNLKYFLPGLALSAIGVAAGVFSLKMDEFGRLDSFRTFYAVALSLAAGVQLAFFGFLLKAPGPLFIERRDALLGYRNFLVTELGFGREPQGYLTPSQTGHLAYSLALGLDLGRMAIRRGQARWFSSRSGPFVIGAFAAALRTLGRRFKS